MSVNLFSITDFVFNDLDELVVVFHDNRSHVISHTVFDLISSGWQILRDLKQNMIRHNVTLRFILYPGYVISPFH